jgi:hypothetical protein
LPKPSTRASAESRRKAKAAETAYARPTGFSTGRSGGKVNLDAVFALVGNVAAITLSAWRGLFALDMVALADAGSREDFDDLEFMVSRALGELNGVKNLLALVRRMV